MPDVSHVYVTTRSARGGDKQPGAEAAQPEGNAARAARPHPGRSSLYCVVALRIRNVYPGSEFFPSRIPDRDPGSTSKIKGYLRRFKSGTTYSSKLTKIFQSTGIQRILLDRKTGN